MTSSIFLDYASATPQSDASIAAMQHYLQKDFYNPSALYLAAKKVKHDLESFRADVAHVLQVRPSEIYFMAGATEANNTVIHGVVTAYPDSNCLYSDIEHDSVRNAVDTVTAKRVAVTIDGTLDLQELATKIDDHTSLIVCMYANNEIGTIQPIHDIVTIVEKVKKDRLSRHVTTPLYIHVDASQSFQYIPLLPHKLGIDSAVIGAGKIYGPKQSAILYIKAGMQVKPLLQGGGQEYGMRPGTENIALIAGATTAIKETDTLRHAEAKRMHELQSYFFDQLSKIESIHINGSIKHRIPNNVHITIAGVDNEMIVMQLDEMGVMAATGSACHASSDEPSTVLSAIGLDEQSARSSIRFSMGRQTSKKDIDTTITKLRKCLHR